MAYFKQYCCIVCMKTFDHKKVEEDDFPLWGPEQESLEFGFDYQTEETVPDKNGLYELNHTLTVRSKCKPHEMWHH